MKKSIVRKLFLSITILLVIFLLIVFAGQSAFLQTFYIKKKTDLVTEELTNFVNQYSKGELDQKQFQEEITNFYTKYNTSVAILDNRGVIKAQNNFDLTVMTDNGRKVFVPLNNLLYSDQIDDILALNIKKNENITIKGYLHQDYFVPVYIKTNSGVWEDNNQLENPLNFDSDANVFINIVIKGTVTELHLPLSNQYSYSAQMNSLMNAVSEWAKRDTDLSKYSSKDFPIKENYLDKISGIQNRFFVYPFKTPDGSEEIAIALTSLQPVNEAMFVLKGFFINAFIVGLLLIIIISFYFSKIITKPLLKINTVTNQLAQLNFNEKIEVKSEDEIGELSKSINSLSEKLASTIENLQKANSQLMKDIEKEKQLENIRKEFISGVSHELKTPLSIVQSYAEGLKDGLNVEKNGYYADVILEEVERMNHLVIDMLELSKLQSGTYKLLSKPFFIVECVEHALNRIFDNSLINHTYDLIVQIEEDTLVIGEVRKIEQVLTNILSNAIRYGRPDSVIKIMLTDEGRYIGISIFNEGTLIPEEQLDKIWDRFYKVDQSRNRQNGGTGLGLAIVKTIIDLHQSTINVQNKQDGVEFKFTLKKDRI